MVHGSVKRFQILVPLLVLFALAVGVAGATWYFRQKPQEPLEMVTLTYSGKDFSPAVSPDGKLIAFRSDRDGTSRIWLKQLAGGNEVVLTSGPDDYPRFSADGQTIFFIRRQGDVNSLYRTPVLGGEQRKLLQDVQYADPSPDGKRIAFVRSKNADSALYTADINGTGVELLTPIKKMQIQFPRWSPDGARIVANKTWVGNVVNLDAIIIVDVKTKQERWFKSTWPTGAVWHSANQILYGLPRSATSIGPYISRMAGTVVLQDVDNQNIRKLLWFPSCGDVLEKMGEGSVLLQTTSMRENLRQIDMEETDSTGQWFTRGSSIDRQPVYSRDGKRILFSSLGSGTLDLMQVTIETGAVTRVTDDAADDWDPYYTPDGNQILWSSNREGHFEIWMANQDGSDSRRISNDGLDAENPTMTADGQWIVYNSYNPEKLGVWKIHPDGTEATKLASGSTQFPEVSPDGKFVAYNWYKQSVQDLTSYIQVVDLETGKRVAFEVKTGYGMPGQRALTGFAGRVRWMPDGKAIAYIDSNNTGQFGVYVQDFLPGQDTYPTRRAIAGFDPDRHAESFGISPDGAFITLAEVEFLSSLVRAKNVPGL